VSGDRLCAEVVEVGWVLAIKYDDEILIGRVVDFKAAESMVMLHVLQLYDDSCEPLFVDASGVTSTTSGGEPFLQAHLLRPSRWCKLTLTPLDVLPGPRLKIFSIYNFQPVDGLVMASLTLYKF